MIIAKMREEALIKKFLTEQDKSDEMGKHKLEIVILNLGLVIGPTLIKSAQGSVESVFLMLNGSMPAIA